EQLNKVLGEDAGSEAVNRLKALASLPAEIATMSAKDLEQKLGNLAAEVAANRGVAEGVARVGLERYGPAGLLRKAGGWKSLSLALGNDSAVGGIVKQWRDGM